jgi:hypothetical protein
MSPGGFVPSEADGAEGLGPPSVTFANGGLSWTRVALPRLLSRIAKVCFSMTALGAVALAIGQMESFALAATLGALAWPLWIVSYILSLTQNSFNGALEVSSTELVVYARTRRRSIPLAKIAGALVVGREVFGALVPTVEIELTNGDILTARLPDPAAAEAVVKKLGFGGGGRRVDAGLGKPSRRLFHPLLGFAAYLAGTTGMMLPNFFTDWSNAFAIGYALFPLTALALYAALTRLVRPPRITVGEDGVLVKGALRRRFVARKDIVSVVATDAALIIEPHGGERIVVGGVLLDRGRRAAIARIIEDRRAPSAAAADRLGHYDRGGRALAEWREHLARAMNESSYRQRAATVDEAAAVLHSAEASPEQRVGAALALRVAGQPKERIRVAVDGAVDDRVREALEAVAEASDAEDDVVIEKALRRLQRS